MMTPVFGPAPGAALEPRPRSGCAENVGPLTGRRNPDIHSVQRHVSHQLWSFEQVIHIDFACEFWMVNRGTVEPAAADPGAV